MSSQESRIDFDHIYVYLSNVNVTGTTTKTSKFDRTSLGHVVGRRMNLPAKTSVVFPGPNEKLRKDPFSRLVIFGPVVE